jgi:putative CocE/NonD family hydrolase
MHAVLLPLLGLGLLLALDGTGHALHATAQPGHEVAADRYRGASAKPAYRGSAYSSRYLTMRDGVRIAVDLYLPKGLEPGRKIPAILEQSRYGRRIQLRAPFRWFIDTAPPYARFFARHGYAWVEIDVRGSSASFGSIAYPWSPDEIADANEVVNWIIRQPWSNGRVGATGLSYSGESAEFLLANRNPAVKAIAPYFAFWDTYEDTAFPGGVYLTWFIRTWSKLMAELDVGAYSKFHWYLPLAVRGIQPVDDDPNGSALRQALAQHNNIRFDTYLNAMVYRDDTLPEVGGILDGFSPAVRERAERAFSEKLGIISLSSPDSYAAALATSGAAIYSFDGWFDAAYARGALVRLRALSNPQKLVIGPWIHGVFRNVNTGERFDQKVALLRFFDYYLRDIQNGFTDEPQITYYTMVEERWKTTNQWPLPNQITASYYLRLGHALAPVSPTAREGADVYTVDYHAGTGRHSRWEPLMGPEFSGGSSRLDYGDRRMADRRLLTYDTPALATDIEVTGHPIVTLYVSSTATDGNFFAYLEDVHPDGMVTYVTEGELRASNHKLSDSKSSALSASVFPLFHHSFLRRDREMLMPGVVVPLVFDLLPTSYLFRRHHAIRLSLAGADCDHFASFGGAPPRLRFEHNAAYPSRIDLPVIPHG